jgi:hypothetical protein
VVPAWLSDEGDAISTVAHATSTSAGMRKRERLREVRLSIDSPCGFDRRQVYAARDRNGGVVRQ